MGVVKKRMPGLTLAQAVLRFLTTTHGNWHLFLEKGAISLLKKNALFSRFPTIQPCGPTRSLIGCTLAVSQVNARHPSFQPPWMVASIE